MQNQRHYFFQKYYIKFIFSFIFILNPLLAHAEALCFSYLQEEYPLYENLNPISFAQSEIFRKNNNIGPQQNGILKFEKWSEMTFEYFEVNPKTEPPASIIGLTEEGRLYHLVKFRDRTIARLLSGTHFFKDFQLTNKGRIMAWDHNGQSYFYSAPLWNVSTNKQILKRWLKLWGLTSAGAVALTTALFPEIPLPVEVLGLNFNFPMVELMFTGVSGLSSGLAMASRYEHFNTYTDGFIFLGYPAEKNFWLDDTELKKYLDNNLNDFEPPKENHLEPKLDPEFATDIHI